MKKLIPLMAVLLVLLVVSAYPQATGQARKTQEDILKALGKVTLAEMKKALPRATETSIRPEAGSRLAQVGAVTKLTEPGGNAVYYFNRAGVLVSAQTKAAKPIPKETLMREIKGLQFKKFPPNQISAAFVRRSPTVVQGFYLDKDDRYVILTTYDYIPK